MLQEAPLLLAAMLGVLEPSPVGERLDLTWEAPDGCPRVEEIRRSVDGYLGTDSFGPELDRVRLAGHVRPGAGKFVLDIEVELPEGTVRREVTAERCAELADAAGLLIAVALDPLRTSQRLEVPAPEAPPPREEPPKPRSPPTSSVVPQPSTKKVAWELRAAGAGELGTLPSVGGGTWLALGAAGPRWRAELSGQYWFPRTIRPFDAAPAAGARVSSFGGGARACFVAKAGPLELPSCASLEGGVMRARGVSLSQVRTSSRPWLATSVGQELVWISSRRIGVFVAVDLVINVLRPTFVVDDLGRVFAAGPVGGRLLLGPQVRI